MAFNVGKYFSFLSAPPTPAGDQEVLGIDIGSSAIKVVQLKRTPKAITLVTYGELQLGPYADMSMGQTIAANEEVLTQALVDVIRESAANATSGILAIPYAASFMTVVTISAGSIEEIASRVPIEARKYIPVPMKEVTLDWFPISTVEHKTSVDQLVLLAALHNDSLTKFRGVLNGINMTGAPSEIEVFSAIRAAMMPEDDLVAVIDMGASATKIYIVREGTVRQMYSTKTGGVALTEAISKTHSNTFAEAEVLKRTYGLSTTDAPEEIREALLSPLNRVFGEMRHLMQRFDASDEGSITKVILTGGGAEMIGIVPHAKEAFQREVVVADPFAKVAYPAFMEDLLTKAGPNFTVAIGAALRALLEAGDE